MTTFEREPRAGLFETMRVEGTVVRRLDAHLTRLARSAGILGLPFDRERAEALVRDDVAAAAAGAAGASVARLRLDLAPNGTMRVRREPFADDPPGWTAHVVLADERIDAEDGRRAHKTTDRSRYDEAAAWARAAGVADVLFLNTRGTVAEGAISTVFVRRGDHLLTPPIADGALPGVLRAELLGTGEAIEASLVAGDLASGLHLGSALRGLRRAVLVAAPS